LPPDSHQEDGFLIVVPGIGFGNCDAASRLGLMWRTKLATFFKDRATLEHGQMIPTGLPSSSLTMRIGSTRSVSFDSTTPTSKRSLNASLSRRDARFTSDPFSSVFTTETVTGFGRMKLGGGLAISAHLVLDRKLPLWIETSGSVLRARKYTCCRWGASLSRLPETSAVKYRSRSILFSGLSVCRHNRIKFNHL